MNVSVFSYLGQLPATYSVQPDIKKANYYPNRSVNAALMTHKSSERPKLLNNTKLPSLVQLVCVDLEFVNLIFKCVQFSSINSSINSFIIMEQKCK